MSTESKKTEEKEDYRTIAHHKLRQLIGWAGLLLPFACWGINALFNQMDVLNNPMFVQADCSLPYPAPEELESLKSSVSHFYYTAAGPLFTGVLITLAAFLFCYTGHKRDDDNDLYPRLSDNLMANAGAVAALGIVILPTDSGSECIPDRITIFQTTPLIGNIHLVCAGLFFIIMALFCLINFRREKGKKFARNTHNTWFLIAGWGMLISLAGLLVYMLLRKLKIVDEIPYIVFVTEVLMLMLFGSAWLVKSKATYTEPVVRLFGTADTKSTPAA